jgi:hypothetical protein
MGDQPLRFGLSAREPGGPRARDVKAWVRAAAGAPEDATIVVTELACSEPGCPPYEVVMAVLRPGAPPVQKKLHKRLAELSRAEVTRLWQEGEGESDGEGERERDHHQHHTEE